MDTRDIIDFSCLNTERGQCKLSLHSPSINDNVPLGKQYPEVLEHIMAKINQALLNGGDNCLFNKYAAINGIKPMLFDRDGAPIPESDTLYKILQISKKNTGFIVDRLKECALSVGGYIMDSNIDKKKQFDIFCEMAEIFADNTKNDKFTAYTINGEDTKAFSPKKLSAMQAYGANNSKYYHQ